MSRNLSQTLFYEFYKSDPNFIYESVEEYRNYKSDPDFADKTLEEYRRVKALQKKEEPIPEMPENDEEQNLEESTEDCIKTTTTTTTENEIETVGDNRTETEIESRDKIEDNIVVDIEKELTELKMQSMAQQEFEQSLETFWNREEAVPSITNSETLSRCSSETLSIFNPEIKTKSTSESALNTNANKKKSKFRIPKSRSTLNLNHVKSRYMDVFKKDH